MKLFIVDNHSKISFYNIILSFYLAINLWIKGNRKFLLDFYKISR